MKNYIYTVLKDFARNYTEKRGVRPSKWDCVCYMNGYKPDESIHNVFEVLDVLEDEGAITYSIPADGWGALSPSPYRMKGGFTMTDKEKVLKGLKCCCAMSGHECRQCPYSDECIGIDQPYGMAHLAADALEQIQAYQRLLEWAVECDFGYDNIPELYEQYKNDIESMSYTDGLLYLASRSLKQE